MRLWQAHQQVVILNQGLLFRGLLGLGSWWPNDVSKTSGLETNKTNRPSLLILKGQWSLISAISLSL